MLHFFTLNTAPLGVIEKHVKLLNPCFVYVRENECCNKWASVFVIVSNYTRRNNSVETEPMCSPFTLTRQRPRYPGALSWPTNKNNNKKLIRKQLWKLSLFISSCHCLHPTILITRGRIILLEVLDSVSFTCVFY